MPILLTGYYEPTLQARTRPDARFRHPVHGPPSGSRGPGVTRAQIESGALEGRGLELFWVDDPIELFFLHVQGSGRLELPDGRIVRVGYAASNGQPYRSIGSELVALGVFTPAEATAPAIKRWLRTHPAEVQGLLQKNARYIFFRILDTPADLGPPGSLGASLVPWRSVAVDPAVTNPGSVGLLVAPLPDGRELAHFVVAMDGGAAIRGPARLDLFLGPGLAAETLAGELRSAAHVAWLAPRR
ncbi:MAG: murein transglycosylase [Deltaproteobacteria bacterium]|nr:murein transglycosylase [Deltaproteobacteria bacterium]